MKIHILQNKIESFYDSLEFDSTGKIIVPPNLKPYIMLLIALLSFLKVFTNEKTDKLIDEIIKALESV